MADAEHAAQLAALIQRIEALEASNANLREELERVRVTQRSPMHATGRCPACGSGSLFHFVRVQEEGHMDQRRDLSLQIQSLGWRGYAKRAPLEAFACRTCRSVEWRAANLDNVTGDGKEVIAIETQDVSPTAGPYR
ncbi:MAG: hypothetical protein AB7O24_05460 [Kofleriaceae bacterium]